MRWWFGKCRKDCRRDVPLLLLGLLLLFLVAEILFSPQRVYFAIALAVMSPLLILSLCGVWIEFSPRIRKSVEQNLQEIVQDIADEYLPNVEKTGYLSDGTKALLVRDLMDKVRDNPYVQKLNCSVSGTEEPVPAGQPVELLIKVVCKDFNHEIVVEAAARGISKNKFQFVN